MIDLNQHKLKLDYPCEWEYKVVIRTEQKIKNILGEVFEQREHKVSKSKSSSKGKFESFNVKLLVHNDDDRKTIYKLLGEHQHIKMVV